jgi:hypothetical protein
MGHLLTLAAKPAAGRRKAGRVAAKAPKAAKALKRKTR